MKNLMKTLIALSLLAAMAATSGIRYSADQPRQFSGQTIHHMVADGDIGDGTSPAKKG